MAFNITTNYDGEWSKDYYSSILFGAQTPQLISQAGSLLVRVKNKLTIPQLEVGTVLQEDGCDFDALGDVTITEKPITVCDMKLNVELCKTSLETTFESAQMTAGAMNSNIPADLQSYILDRIRLKTSSDLDQIIWKGDSDITGTSVLRLCDGFFKKFLADATVVDQAATAVTSANVLAELQKVYDKIPDSVWNLHNEGTQTVKIMVSTNIARAYANALATSSANANFNIAETSPLFYKGIEVVTIYAYPSDTMVCTYVSNLWLATDLIEDFGDIALIDMSATDGSDNIRMKGRMKLGVEYKFGSHIVYYS